jgi:hypothetical protein
MVSVWERWEEPTGVSGAFVVVLVVDFVGAMGRL